MKTIAEQIDNPYAAPQAELTLLATTPKFSRDPIGFRSTIFYTSLKVGFYCGCLFCLPMFTLFCVDIVKQFDLARALEYFWLLVLYGIYILIFLSLLGGIAGVVLMFLDLVLQVLGLSEPPQRESGEGGINLKPRHLLIDLVRE